MLKPSGSTPAQAGGAEHAGQNGPQNAAHAVDAENVAHIIGFQQALEARHAPQAQRAGHQAHDDGAHRARQGLPPG